MVCLAHPSTYTYLRKWIYGRIRSASLFATVTVLRFVRLRGRSRAAKVRGKLAIGGYSLDDKHWCYSRVLALTLSFTGVLSRVASILCTSSTGVWVRHLELGQYICHVVLSRFMGMLASRTLPFVWVDYL